MKFHKIIFTLFCLSFAKPAFALTVSELEGNWSGFLLTNIKEVKDTGGHTAQGDTTTPIQMLLQSTKTGVAGFSRVGVDKIESWEVTKKNFNWSNGKIFMTTRRISAKDMPSWAQARLAISPGRRDDFLIYHYDSCRLINEPATPCVFGRDLAKADLERAVFVFEKHDDELRFHALYTFDKEQTQKRILQWAGKKRKSLH